MKPSIHIIKDDEDFFEDFLIDYLSNLFKDI
jgi:hypothetical protein